MKTFKRALCVLLSVLFVIPLLPVSFAADGTDEGTVTGTGFTSEDLLKTSGTKIVNQKGEEVILKGVNLGGWLIQEDWLCPYEEVTDNYEIIETLKERFGTEKAYELMGVYEDNWITEYDLDEIKEMGFNCVRVPFWYKNFYTDDDGTKLLDKNGNWDFHYLDWIVSECSKRNIYVVLDMHGAPGFQSDAPHSGKTTSCGLYDQTEQGERYRELTDELWTAIAERFVGNPAVAMYDLLNEPMCDVKCTEIKRRINNEYIYTRLYNTVKKADSSHIMTLECIWTGFALPKAYFKNWTNVVYQVHFYNNSDFIFNFFLGMTRVLHPTVPLMMGEFYPLGKTTWNGCFKSLKKWNYSWMTWTYKAAGHGMWSSDWCLFGCKDGFERARIKTDTYEEIARKWGSCLNTDKGCVATGHYDTIKPYL